MNNCKVCHTWRDFKNIILILICVLALAAIGCRSLADRVTPAEMPRQVSTYLDIEHREFVSLHDLRGYKDEIIIKHRTEQTDLLRQAQDDETFYQDAIAFIQARIAEAQELQDLVIGDEGQPFSILGLLAGFTGGAAIGRALKRKGDYSPEEVQVLLNGKNTHAGTTT